MEDRLLHAAEHLEKQMFEQFNIPYTEMALKFNKAITRGGDPELYEKEYLIELMAKIKDNQVNEYTIQPKKLPTEIPYISLDVPNDQIDELKDAMGGVQKGEEMTPLQKRFFERVDKQNSKYKELFGLDKEGWYKQFPTITYKLNSEGMRNEYNFNDLEENKFIPVFGDSNTFGMGLPEKDLWYNHLGVNLPIYNSSVISGNLMDAYILLTTMYNTKKFDKAYICIPHSERFTAVSEIGYIEGITNGDHYFLKQFQNTGEFLNQNTRQMYRWIATQGIINFCILHDIELQMWDKNTFSTVMWCTEKDLYLPNWYFMYKHMNKNVKIVNECEQDVSQWYKHTARDFVHFGTEWQQKIAEYMLTNNSI